MKAFLQGNRRWLVWTLPFLLVGGGRAEAQDSTLLQGANRPQVSLSASPSQPEPVVLPDPVRFGHAMELGDMFQARRWLDGGLNPEFEADRIGTGLMIGAWSGNIPLMELFLAHGGTVEHRNSLGETALLLAAWKGQTEAVRWLLDHGAAVNRPNGQWTALHYGAFAGHQDVVDLLLARGGDINARSPNGSSVLMMAVYDGHEAMAKHLLARGADPKVRNEWGDGALEWAVKFEHMALARAISTPEEFAAVANRPRSDWGLARRSEQAPAELERLLQIRRAMQAKGYSVERIDGRIAAARAKYARVAAQALPPSAMALEISARRANPKDQSTRLVGQDSRSGRGKKAKTNP